MTASPTIRALRPGIVLIGLLALAVNLRAALAGYPPLLNTVRAELGIAATVAGLAQTGAVLLMAAGSLAGPGIGSRWGRERALVAAVGLVAVGSVLRGVPVLPALLGGSLVIGFGIGVAGVLLTGVVKDRLADRAGAVTGGYVVAMMVGSTIAAGGAVPLAVVLGGWSWSLAVWAVPAVLAAAAWVPVARAAGAPTVRAGRGALPWRDPFARLAAGFMACTSLLVYGWLTWLAPYYASLGWSPQAAGALVAVWSLAHIPAALLVPALAERRRRWRFWSLLTLAVVAAGTVGALLLPDPPLLGGWLWAALIGFGSGAAFPLGIAVMTWRTPDGGASAAVSGMALGVGYTVAGLGPLLMGLLVDLSGFPAAIAVLLVALAAQIVLIVRIGDA